MASKPFGGGDFWHAFNAWMIYEIAMVKFVQLNLNLQARAKQRNSSAPLVLIGTEGGSVLHKTCTE
jgi:hypothetical protein